MKFLFVRPDVCRRLPSDSTSQWTPLPLAIAFPLLGQLRDLHPLDNTHAERTNTAAALRAAAVVRMKGLEPPRLTALDPKSNAATNYATSPNKPVF